MGLAEIQNALARLYTDAELRERFFEDAKSVGREFGLNDEEINQLSKISSDELSFFSDSLLWKRLNEVEKLLPLTKKMLSEDFKDLFQSFAPTHNSTEIKKHLDDAIAFSKFLERKIQIGWQVDLIRFEAARLEFNGMNRKLIVKRFYYDVIDLIEKISGDEQFEIAKQKKWIGIWFRMKKQGDGKFYVL